MAISKRPRERSEDNTVPLEDEADILAEVGAERDEETGELLVDSDEIRRIGAVDPDSVRENRRLRKVAAKKKAKEKVSFGSNDPLVQYDVLIASGTPATAISVHVKRLNGGPPVQDVILSRPRNGVELLTALKNFHAQNGGMEAEYEVKFKDSSQQFVGTARITLPDVRPPHLQGQSMPYGQPPVYPGANWPQQPAAQQPEPQQPAQPAPQAQQPVLSQVQQMEQMFEFFRRMQQPQQPQQQSQPQQPQPQFPTMPQGMPGTLAEMMAMFEFFQRMQPQPQPQPAPQPSPQPQQQPQPAQPMGMPTFPAPAGTQWMYDPRGGWVAVPVGGFERRPPPRPQYERHEDQPPQRGPQSHFGPPQRPMSPAAVIRNAITEVRSAAEAVREFESILPGSSRRDVEEDSGPDDDSSFVTEEIGKIKLIRSKESGDIQPLHTGLANLPDAMKWLGEQYDKIQKNAAQQRQQQQQQRRVLPPNVIEIIPGQTQVPEGYVAVAVSPEEEQRIMQQQVVTPEPQSQQQLPPVPNDVPPPIQAETPAVPRRSWGLTEGE